MHIELEGEHNMLLKVDEVNNCSKMSMNPNSSTSICVTSGKYLTSGSGSSLISKMVIQTATLQNWVRIK